jgi:uncharacterized protein involved in outer membrane biogenesis
MPFRSRLRLRQEPRDASWYRDGVLSRPVKIVLRTLGVVVLLVMVTGAVSALYLTYAAKPRVQGLATQSLGIDVTIGGAVHIGLLPSPHLALADVHIGSQHHEIATAGAVSLGFAFLPLLHHQVRIDRITLKRVSITLERDQDGNLNIRGSGHGGPLPDIAVAKVSGSSMQLRYKDDRTGNGFEAEDCTLDLSRLRVLPAESADWVKYVSFAGRAACRRLRLVDLEATDVSLSVEGSDGVVDINPVSLRLLEGFGNGSIRVDLTHPEPLYQIRYTLAGLRLEELGRKLSATPVGSGALDFAANLSMRGGTLDELTRTASGNASLRGNDLTLQLGDLDKQFERFESTQTFNLMDAGAFLVAGPIGLGITKGYDYARALRTAAGTTHVHSVVSEWRIEKGVAHATDVALATDKNRVASKGNLNFVTREFEDVTVALVNREGCAEAEQKVHGPFLKPEVDAPNALKVLAAPTRHLLDKATSLLGHKCISFYAGSVEAPS